MVEDDQDDEESTPPTRPSTNEVGDALENAARPLHVQYARGRNSLPCTEHGKLGSPGAD